MARGGARPGAGRKKQPAKEQAASAPPVAPSPPAAAVQRPVGAPPERLSADARQAWRELAQRAAPGVLTWRHRVWLEGVALQLARLRACEWDASAGELTRMQAALVRLKLVPA